MRPQPFKLERYFANHEFSARYLLSSSDCETVAMSELVEMADPAAREAWEALRLGYTQSKGLPELREEIAGLYEKAPAGAVLCGVPEELIFVAMSSTLGPGDHVVCTFPGYQSLYSVAESLGCDASYWRVREGGGWSFEAEDLDALLRPETRAVVVNFPHNPTGALPARAVLEHVVEAAGARDAWLFSDEMYRLLEFDPAARLPAACDMYEKAVSLSGLSKSFGLAGLRSGWLACRDKAFNEAAASFKDYTTICASAPGEVLSLMALRSRDVIIRRNLERIERNLKVLDRFFEDHKATFSWSRPEAGSIGLARLLEGSASQFCEEVLSAEGILLLPSTVFDFGDSHFRLGFGREDMPDVLARLASHIS